MTCEIVSDGGGRFIPAGIIVGLHTLSLLLASLVAHGRATEENHTARREPGTNTHEHNRTQPNTTKHYSWVQYIILDREVLTPSPYEERIDADVNSHADETVVESYVNNGIILLYCYSIIL